MDFLVFLMYMFGLAISILPLIIALIIGWRIMIATERIANALDKKDENVQVKTDDVQKEGEGWKEEDGWEEEEDK